ncbi:MAG: PilZ domain-containing protein [Desulfobacterales bacterium]|nr:PilZ domain-containing protein [Desulfobacterales bacterium]
MTDDAKMNERRIHRRYKVKAQAFAALASHYLIGQIKNISKGGISFTCIANVKPDSQTFEIEIFTQDDKFHLREIPFKIVSAVDVEDRIPSSALQKKQINGVFLELTDSQVSQLEYFLDNYILAEN